MPKRHPFQKENIPPATTAFLPHYPHLTGPLLTQFCTLTPEHRDKVEDCLSFLRDRKIPLTKQAITFVLKHENASGVLYKLLTKLQDEKEAFTEKNVTALLQSDICELKPFSLVLSKLKWLHSPAVFQALVAAFHGQSHRSEQTLQNLFYKDCWQDYGRLEQHRILPDYITNATQLLVALKNPDSTLLAQCARLSREENNLGLGLLFYSYCDAQSPAFLAKLMGVPEIDLPKGEVIRTRLQGLVNDDPEKVKFPFAHELLARLKMGQLYKTNRPAPNPIAGTAFVAYQPSATHDKIPPQTAALKRLRPEILSEDSSGTAYPGKFTRRGSKDGSPPRRGRPHP